MGKPLGVFSRGAHAATVPDVLRRLALAAALVLAACAPAPVPAQTSPATPPPGPSGRMVAVIRPPSGGLVFAPLDGAGRLPDGEVLAVSSNPKAETDSKPDPLRPQQWGLDRIGAKPGMPSGDGVVVAVVDTGVDGTHPDLEGRVLEGVDLVEGGDGRVDPNGHGTHIAGIIAAVADNGIGVEGVTPGAYILPVRVLGPDGVGDHATIAEGVVWAVDRGADVINLSLGGPESSEALEYAVSYAVERGVAVVAAAGNDGPGSQEVYPAAYPGVVGVAASSFDDSPTLFSSTGPWVDLAAPGLGIVSTLPGGGYGWLSGSSQAAAFVSGAAASYLSAGGADASRRLVETARDVGPPGRDDGTGWGVVDLSAALGGPPTDPGASPLPSPAPPEPPPSGSPPRAPLPALEPAPMVAVAPASPRVVIGEPFEAIAQVLGCRGCVLRVRAPGGYEVSAVVPSDPATLTLSLIAAASGRLSWEMDGLSGSGSEVAAVPQVTVTSASRRGRFVSVAGGVTGADAVTVERLEGTGWRPVASGRVSDGRFSVSFPSPPGLFRVTSGGGSSRVFRV